MNQAIYIILNGNNGATYILNTKSVTSLASSLEFYKARTFKQRALKKILLLVLVVASYFNRILRLRCFKTVNEIEQYICSLRFYENTFIDDNSSLLISPTRDKIIVHHHNQYFQKFGFSGSYKNVKHEAEIYQIIADRPKHFGISSIHDLFDNGVSVCSFKMKPPACLNKTELVSYDLVLPLVEFFNFSRSDSSYVFTLVTQLESKLVTFFPDSLALINQVLDKLKSYEDYRIIRGLVHGDFKPWNILGGSPVVFFDFEETMLDGLPLEDLFNYIIDSEIRYKTSQAMSDIVFNTTNIQVYKKYLHCLGCESNYLVLLYLYLLRRSVFWYERSQHDVSFRYLSLLELINNSEHALND